MRDFRMGLEKWMKALFKSITRALARSNSVKKDRIEYEITLDAAGSYVGSFHDNWTLDGSSRSPNI